jgi:hypothetical protein
MKKNLLLLAALFAGAATFAQECTAVATIDEDFSDFTIGTGWAGENCWNRIALGFMGGGGLVYTAQSGDPANQYINYYSATGVNVNSYLISPEVSTFDGAHELSFKAWKLGQGGSIPAGTVTVQVGTMTSLTDAATFVALEGASFTLTSAEGDTTAEVETFSNIVIPSAPAGSHIAFRLSSNAVHNAIAIDDVVWSEVTAPACEAVSTLNEDFSDFTVATSGTFPENCWDIIANGFPSGPAIYTDENDGDDKFVTFYAGNSANTDAYLITPEIATFSTGYTLSFDAWRVAMGPSVPGTVTIQVGTITGDASTFVALTEGGSFTLTSATPATYNNIIIPSAPEGSHIAFRISGNTAHNAASIDNIIWTATASVEDLNKSAFSIYPNPATGKNVTVAFNADNADLVSIYSLTGAKVFEAKASGTSLNLDLNSLSSGMYIVKVQSGSASTTQKLLLQ